MARSADLIEQLGHLHVDRSHGPPAPHKPLMLLAILDLVEEGVIEQNYIEHAPRLIERFNHYWSVLDPVGFQARSWLPFFHLRYDGFWVLSPQEGADQQLVTLRSPKSNRQLHAVVSHAELTDEVWNLIQSEDVRKEMRSALLASYFSDEDQAKLNAAIREEKDISGYIEGLLDYALREPFQMQHDESPVSTTTRHVRDRAFRRLIRQLYDEACCMCELRLVTDDGHSVLEAAHIIPYAKSFNDDPRNGLGLCPVHHWCYDEGLIGISPNYVVTVSEALVETRPTENRLIRLRGQRARLPRDESLQPAREALERHCQEHSIPA